MRSALGRILATAFVALLCIGGWMLARSAGILSSSTQISIFFLANLILMFDMVDLVARIWITSHLKSLGPGPSVDLGLEKLSKAEMAMTLRPYAIVGSVHDASDDIDRFLEAMQPFKEFVWLIDDASNDDTLLRLRSLGWNCFAGGINRKKPGALYHLMQMLPRDIETVLVVDPDVKLTGIASLQREVLEHVICDLQRSGAASVSPRIVVQQYGWLEESQAFECVMSCGLGRKSVGNFSTCSGIAMYRRSALEGALARHTLSVYAEDLENSLLLLAAGERIYFDDRLSFVTTAMRTWKRLFSQRVGWAFGGAKVCVERFPQLMMIARRSPLAAYQYVYYLTISGFVMLPMKLISVGILLASLANGIDDLLMIDVIPDGPWDEPVLFALWYVKMIVTLIIATIAALPRGGRLRHLQIIPFYAFYQLLQYAPMAVGVANYITLRFFGRRIYADHYDAAPKLRGRGPHAVPTRS